MYLRESRGFNFDPAELEAKITPKTKLLILNSPQNPTGGVIPAKDMEAIAAILAKHPDIWVYADEIYSRLVYDGEFASLAAIPGMQERTIICDGASKTWAMTGWRLGYAVNRALAPVFTRWVTNTESCASQISQWAAVEAISGPQDDADRMRASFLERRDLIVGLLNKVPGVTCQSPGGAFYAWPNVTEGLRDDRREGLRGIARAAAERGRGGGAGRHPLRPARARRGPAHPLQLRGLQCGDREGCREDGRFHPREHALGRERVRTHAPPMLDIAAACLAITAVMAWFNHRFVGLPTTIGVMVVALAFSFVLLGLNLLGFQDLYAYEVSLLASINFSEVLMQGMLSFLLFAGAMHVDLSELRAYRWPVAALAVAGTMASTLLIGFALWTILPYTGHTLPLVWCLLFGALISPTDPIAVMGILKTAGVPRSLEVVISGESLFNDGMGVVIFALILGMLASGEPPTLAHGATLLAHEAGGGIVFGFALGYVTYRLLRSIDSYEEEVLITLAAVLGGYALASRLHVSGPLAMVVAGLMIGNHGRALAMSDKTREYLDMFWELVDSILNALLFVLIGLEVILVAYSPGIAIASLAAIGITLATRLATVGAPVAVVGGAFGLPPKSWKVLTWGGLRGGISVALALTLPAGPERDLVLALTYSVVVFSILAQGLTIGRVARSTAA